MHRSLLDRIRCPACGHTDFHLQVFQERGDLVEEGVLTCAACATWFRIEQSITDLLPMDLRRWSFHQAFASRHSLSAGPANPATRDTAKREQIDFFATDSATYEQEITRSPCFAALDTVTLARWLDRQAGQSRRFLDLGCGTGRQSLRIAESGSAVVGADISEEMLRVAAATASDRGLTGRLDLVVADAERLPLRDGVFDACISIGTLHHVPRPDRVVSEACRAVAEGGALLFYDPHRSPVRFVFDLLMRRWKLYEEKASKDPLMTEADMNQWLSARNADCVTRLSVYLPPHVFYRMNPRWNVRIMSATDRLFNAIPGLRKCGGIIVTEATKRKSKQEPG